MNIEEIKNIVLDYNKKLFSLIDFRKIHRENHEEYSNAKEQFYNDNKLDSKKIETFFKENEEGQQQSWILKIKNNSYYNILDNNSNIYTLIFGSKFGLTKKIKICILPTGEVEYNELKKLRDYIGNPCIERFTIEDLYIILYKLSIENYINVDLTQLKTAIKVNRLNKNFNECLECLLNKDSKKKVLF